MFSPIDEIKSKLDIVDLIQEYVPLKKSGANFKALCPFHTEKMPSFMVSQEKQIWHCFGCGAGGSIFDFVMKIEGLEFPEALRILAKKANVKLVSQDPALQNLKTRLLDIYKLATDFYEQQLFKSPLGKKVMGYLIKERGLNKEIIGEFKLGYAPSSWHILSNFLKNKGFKDNEILQSGLVVRQEAMSRYYDRFRQRLMFPIADIHGNIVGFSGRELVTILDGTEKDPGAKYINTPNTLIYDKSKILYGLDKGKLKIRKKNLAIVVEGNMDVIASHQARVRNVVASSGTSLTQDQIKLLRRYTQNLVFAFDQDIAGEDAAKRGIDLAWQNEMNVKIILMPKGIKDPAECIQKDPKLWLKVLAQSKIFMNWFFDQTFSKFDISKLEEKKEAAQILLNGVIKLKDPIEQDHYLKLLASKLKVEEKVLRDVVSQKVKKRKKFKEEATTPFVSQDREIATCDRLLAFGLTFPQEMKYIIDHLEPMALLPSYQELYKKLIIYYTKEHKLEIENFKEFLKQKAPDLKPKLEVLLLLGEGEIKDLEESQVKKEIIQSLNFLKKKYILKKLKQIEEDLKQVEKDKLSDKVEILTREFNKLTERLSRLE